MTFVAAYCTDQSCMSINIISDGGHTHFSIPSRADETYANLMLHGEIPLDYVSPKQFYCDPRLLTKGKILTTTEFLTQCDTSTGRLLVERPEVTEDWVAAYRQDENPNNIIAYASGGIRLTIEPLTLLHTEINNVVDYLFGGKILSEYEALAYNIDNRYFNLPDDNEEIPDGEIEVDLDTNLPFDQDRNPSIGTPTVDSNVQDFLQLSRTIVEQFYNSHDEPEEITPYLIRNFS